MKHIFVINPNAGRINRVEEITKKLEEVGSSYDYEIYITKSRGDAERFVREYLKESKTDETYRFYAVGGDGTLYDVVNGAYGFPNAEVACLATGSGNDFVKNFADISLFKDIKKALEAKAKPIDLIKANDKYCINITNYGFDGEVTAAQLRFKHWPFVSGPVAYNLAALTSLLFKMNQYLKVVIDGKTVLDEKGLLAIAANGFCYGGGFHCAPKAKIDDGIIDFCLVRKIGRLKAASFMKVFREGEHLTNPKLADKVIYLKGKKATIESNKPVAYAVDGEVFREKKLEITMLPGAIKFAIPE